MDGVEDILIGIMDGVEDILPGGGGGGGGIIEDIEAV